MSALCDLFQESLIAQLCPRYLREMSINSLHDFFERLQDEEDASVCDTSDDDDQDENSSGDASKDLSDSTDQTCIVIQDTDAYVSDASLLADYVIVEIDDENYTPRVKSSISGKQSPVPTHSTPDHDISDDESATYERESDVDDGEEHYSTSTAVRITHVFLPEEGFSPDTSYYEPDQNSSTADAAEEDSDSSEDEAGAEEEEDDSDDDTIIEEGDCPHYGGQLSVARDSNSRLSALNSSLYQTDGENLSEVAISRSFAALHRQEIVEAGAKTIGELYVSLKRKKAQELGENTEEPGENRATSSSQLILHRKDENEKLKNKPKKIFPKSTIPFEEEPIENNRLKSASVDNKCLAVPRKALAGKARTSPNPLVKMDSEIHAEPEVRGDMGYTNASAAEVSSAEPLTPESLTRLCSTGTDNHSSARNKSIDPQLITEVDSSAGYISGRKNPQSKITAVIRDAERSRLPLPVICGVVAEQDTTPDPTRQNAETEAAITGSNWTANSISDKKKSGQNNKQTFKTHHVQLQNPSTLMTKGTARTIDKKPPIPHQMKSIACYHDGKLDVSILGERNLLANTDPLNIKITLLPQVRTDNHAVRTNALPPLKNPPRFSASSKKQNDRSNKTSETNNTSQKTDHHISDKKPARKRVERSKQLPPLKRVTMKYALNGKRNTNRFWSPCKSRKEQKIRRDKVKKTKPLSPIDWNVVNHRAQYPPFNTNTDAEASLRFQKIWCGF